MSDGKKTVPNPARDDLRAYEEAYASAPPAPPPPPPIVGAGRAAQRVDPVTPRLPGELESAWLARRAAKIRADESKAALEKEQKDRASKGLAPLTQADLDDREVESMSPLKRKIRSFLGMDSDYEKRKKARESAAADASKK